MAKQPAKKRIAVHGQSPDPARIVDLNFKVPYEFKKRVRLFALEHDMKVIDVFRMAFERLEREGL
jgi:hypothetical protein